MVGGLPPCPNKAVTSARRWQSHGEREMVGPFRISEGVKMTTAKYVEFLIDHFLPRSKKKNRALISKIIFKHNNVRVHCVAG